ncbi:hypothetical protein G9A89_002975 [Geosiphon pyriformis]|nr:hypothetical protein G9A89_002975 [Geosiphon pyriformis]
MQYVAQMTYLRSRKLQVRVLSSLATTTLVLLTTCRQALSSMSSESQKQEFSSTEAYFATPMKEWSQRGFLEAMQPQFNDNSKVKVLKKIWTRRYMEHLKEIARDRTNKERSAGALLLLNQKPGYKITEFWNMFEKKRSHERQQLSRLRMINATAQRREELAKKVGMLTADMNKNQEDNGNMKRQRDDDDEGGKLKSVKMEGEDSQKSSEENLDDDEKEEEVIQGDKTIRDILDYAYVSSDAMDLICPVYGEHYPDGTLIDLRLDSPFLRKLPEPVAASYLAEMDTITELLIPVNVHQFLVQFFSQHLTATEWESKIDDLQSPNEDDPLLIAVVRILRRTLPRFIKAFSLGGYNPLQGIGTIERTHLNEFVHPCLDAALWHLAKVHYEYGESRISNRNTTDGVGFIPNADKFQLVHVEGSRPPAKEEKVSEGRKISHGLKSKYAKIVKEMIKNRRRLPKQLAVFGGESSHLRIYLYYLDYCGNYRLNEVDNANLPRDFSEMEDFVYFYECILKWGLLVQHVTKSFDEASTEKRLTRLSYAHSLRVND